MTAVFADTFYGVSPNGSGILNFEMRHKIARIFSLLLFLGVAGPPILATTIVDGVQVLSTVGVYDEQAVATNSVDRTAAGSSMSAETFAASIATAFANEQGGVVDASVLGTAGWAIGISQTKAILVDIPTNWAIGGGISDHVSPISGTGYFATSNYPNTSVEWVFGPLLNSSPSERLVQFGVTILSTVDSFTGLPVDFGLVVGTARLSGGGQIVVSEIVNTATTARLNDTFFGFAAPPGQWITSVRIEPTEKPRFFGALKFDDVGFVTATVPEPGSLTLLGLGLCVLLVRYRSRR